MAQPAQVKTGLPSGEFVVIDNGAAGVTSTNGVVTPGVGGSGNWTGPGAVSGGFDLTSGAIDQCINAFGNTGSVLLDPVNDQIIPIPKIATFPGNPVSLTAPTFATLTKVLTNPLSATIVFKNPA
jgi:hypothetical protein